MQKGDSNQQEPPTTTQGVTETLWPGGQALEPSLPSSHDVGNYVDILKVLSEVELPSPSPVIETSCTLTRENNVITFHNGQSSGTNRDADDFKEIIEKEREQKGKQHKDSRQSGVATNIKATEKRRRHRISERIRVLQALVPNCNKRSRASVIGDAIEYIKFLRMQVQMMQSMGVCSMSQGIYLSPMIQPRLQVPNLAPQLTTRPSINMQHQMPQFGSYVPMNIPQFPPYFSGYPPTMPVMEVGPESFPWRQPRPLLYPRQLEFPPQTFQSGYTNIPYPHTIIPPTSSRPRPLVSVPPSYDMPSTSQGRQ